MTEYSDYSEEDARLTKAWNDWVATRPICDECGEPITDEEAYEFPNGDIVCEDCVREYVEDTFRKHIG